MRALGPLIFSFGLTFSGAVPTFESPDRWFAEDKAQHFFLSFALTNAGYGGARLVGISHRPALVTAGVATARSEEHTYELQSRGHLVCRLLLEKKTKITIANY